VLSSVGGRREELLRIAEEGKVEALIFYGKDIPNAQNVAQSANEFQRRSKLPMLIAADFGAGSLSKAELNSRPTWQSERQDQPNWLKSATKSSPLRRGR